MTTFGIQISSSGTPHAIFVITEVTVVPSTCATR